MAFSNYWTWLIPDFRMCSPLAKVLMTPSICMHLRGIALMSFFSTSRWRHWITHGGPSGQTSAKIPWAFIIRIITIITTINFLIVHNVNRHYILLPLRCIKDIGSYISYYDKVMTNRITTYQVASAGICSSCLSWVILNLHISDYSLNISVEIVE